MIVPHARRLARAVYDGFGLFLSHIIVKRRLFNSDIFVTTSWSGNSSRAIMSAIIALNIVERALLFVAMSFRVSSTRTLFSTVTVRETRDIVARYRLHAWLLKKSPQRKSFFIIGNIFFNMLKFTPKNKV